MPLILSAITLLIQFLPQILSSAGVISPAIAALIAQLGGAVPGLITSLATNTAPSADILDLLRAFQGELAVLQTSTGLDLEALAQAKLLDGAITDALQSYEDAAVTCDPSTLTPLPTDLTPAPKAS